MNVGNANEQQQQEKKCRGNRSDQRFRRKCRAQGMKPEKIEQLIQKRKESNIVEHPIHRERRNTTMDQRQGNVPVNMLDQQDNPSHRMRTTMETNNSNKRKRDVALQQESVPKSASSISLRQPSLKNMKKKRQISLIPLKNLFRTTINKNYRLVFI